MENTESKINKRTRNLTLEELKGLLRDTKGSAIKLDKFPDDTKLILKITATPRLMHFDNSDTKKKDKDVAYFSTEYKLDENTRVPLSIQTSKGCYDRFIKSNAGKEYIGKYAIFSKSIFEKDGEPRHGLSIGVIYKDDFELNEYKNPLEMIEAAEKNKSASVQPAPEHVEAPVQAKTIDIAKFVAGFKQQVTAYNEMKVSQGKPSEVKELSVQLCITQYVRNAYPERYNDFSIALTGKELMLTLEKYMKMTDAIAYAKIIEEFAKQ